MLEGENAEVYRSQPASAFASELPAGMNKIASTMSEAHRLHTDTDLWSRLNASHSSRLVLPQQRQEVL
jgi:hypothetical protein